jgi:diguanylate cyclase (GGDEF)-like protein/PAS domain S-box-containing protein
VNSPALASAQPSGQAPLAALLDGLPEAVFLIDDKGAIDYGNPASAKLFGYPAGEMAGRMFPAMLAEPFQAEYAEALRDFSHGGSVSFAGQRREVVGSHQDGTTFPMELTLSEIGTGGVRALAGVARDIRDQKQAEARLRHMAELDSLTGLSNRTSLEQALTRHVEYAARYGSAGSVIALGVDNFKYLNDSLGTEAGDELLREIAALIAGRLRKTDVVGRVGGDVFAVLAHGAGEAKARTVADELLGIIRRHGFVLAGQGVRVTASGGVTSLAARPVTGAELLAEAEAALHDAKEDGRDRVATFDPEGRGEADLKRAWSDRVRQATEQGLFVLVSQPIVDFSTGEPTQHELLLRMRGEGGGLVQPGVFLATAERFGLIQGIDRWVTQQAIRLIAAANQEGRDLHLEVNLSGKTMADANFPAEVKRDLTSSRIDPGNLVFEVTETAAVADIDQARRFAHSLTELGCRFALDDFGAGYASFYYLKHLPISYLKIDGEFVRELPRSPKDQLIIKALVDVCKGLGIRTIAEFVGDEETVDLLREIGVDFGQGYHLGKPAPVSELRAGSPAPEE